MITIKDMAQKAQVSPTTVSNVLNGRIGKMSEETYQRVKDVIDSSNYILNMGARALANCGSKIIGVIIIYNRKDSFGAFEDPFHAELVSAIESRIRESGYYMMLYTADSVEESVRKASSWNIEGLILLGCLPSYCQEFMEKADIPVVFIDSYFLNKKYMYNCVGCEDYQGGYDMTEYLIKKGHKKIAFIADTKWVEGVDKERFDGFSSALLKAGISVDENNFLTISYKKDERHQQLAHFVEHNMNDFTVLFFASDYYAVDAINVFHSLGVKVPDDISVVGFDDNIFADLSIPKLTTVHQNVSQKGVTAVDQLICQIKDPKYVPSVTRAAVYVVERDSVKDING